MKQISTNIVNEKPINESLLKRIIKVIGWSILSLSTILATLIYVFCEALPQNNSLYITNSKETMI